jgi:hypothetical protein
MNKAFSSFDVLKALYETIRLILDNYSVTFHTLTVHQFPFVELHVSANIAIIRLQCNFKAIAQKLYYLFIFWNLSE